MRPSEVLRRATAYLERHGIEGARESAEILLAHVLATDRPGLYARKDGLTSAEAGAFGRALCQRCTGVPVQHLTGRQSFRRLELAVHPAVFVPRPETEILVDAALEVLVGRERPVAVDVGTGTGAVALSLKAERPDATVFATELSGVAATLARQNAARMEVDVTVAEGDLLSPLPADLAGNVDLVVSNPPYVAPEDYRSLPLEVLADPELALVGGTSVHRRLVDESPRWLRSGGWLVSEIGADQGMEVRAMFEERFREVRVIADLAARDRVVAGCLP